MGFFRVLGGWGSPPHGLPAQQQLSACPPACWSASPPACWGDPPNFALLMINQWGFLAGGLLEKRTLLKRKQHFSVSAECWVSVERVSESPMSEWTEWAVHLLSESLATAAEYLTNLQIARKLFSFLRWLKTCTYFLLEFVCYVSYIKILFTRDGLWQIEHGLNWIELVCQ